MKVSGHFPGMVIHIRGKNPDFDVDRNTQVGMAQKINLTMKFEKNYIKMQERGKGIYLDQMGMDSSI